MALRQASTRPAWFYGWRLVAALGVTTIISYGTTSYAFGVLLVPITRDLGWPRAALAGAYALGLLVAGALGVPIGSLVDRYGARLPMTCGSLVGGLVLIGLSRSQQLWQFDLLWGLGLGLANALTFYPVSFTVVANWFQRRRGTAMAWLTTIGGLASVSFIPTIGWLVPRLGWRETLVVLGLAQLALALPLHALVLRRHPEDLGLIPDGQPPVVAPELPGKPTDRPLRGATTREALRRPTFWALTVAGGIDQFAGMVITVHQIAFMVARGFDPLLAASLAGLIGVVSLPGRFLLNRSSDRFGAQGLLALVLTVLGLGVVVLTLAHTVLWLYAYVLIYGAAFGTRSPLRGSVMAEHFGRRSYGAITAIQGIGIAVPAALGPVAAGWLYDRLGSYEMAFWLTAAACFTAAAIVFLTPRPARKR
jgi:MFS family permease